MSGRDPQLALAAPCGWGGRRAGAGRKPGAHPPVPHESRPSSAAAHPIHVTLRMRPDVPSLRSTRLVRAFERLLARGPERESFRVVHYSLQSNHAPSWSKRRARSRSVGE